MDMANTGTWCVMACHRRGEDMLYSGMSEPEARRLAEMLDRQRNGVRYYAVDAPALTPARVAAAGGVCDGDGE